jgi:hypothetical protein
MPHLAVLFDGRQVLADASPGLAGSPVPSAPAVIPAIAKTIVRFVGVEWVAWLWHDLPS